MSEPPARAATIMQLLQTGDTLQKTDKTSPEMGILRLAVRVHSTFGLGGNMTSVRFGVLLGSAVTALLVGTPQPRAETLADTVKSAVAMNPRIKSSVHNRRSIDSEVRRARSLYLPQIDLRAGAGPEFSENADTVNGNRRHIRQE